MVTIKKTEFLLHLSHELGTVQHCLTAPSNERGLDN